MQAEYARRYRTLWERHWWWRSRESLLLDRIGRLARRSTIRRILDAGCGARPSFDRLSRFGGVGCDGGGYVVHSGGDDRGDGCSDGGR